MKKQGEKSREKSQKSRRLFFTAALVSTLALLPTMTPVHAWESCAQNGKLDFGKYWIENNQWNRQGITDYYQCMWWTKWNNRSDTRFGWHWRWPRGNGSIKAYPYVGTWKNGLPIQFSQNKNVWLDFKYWISNTGRYNVSWDLWVSGSSADFAPATAEIMIWLKRTGTDVHPSGTYQTTVNLAGANWEVWKGREGNGTQSWDYFAFVRTTNTEWTENMNAKEFTDYLRNRGWLNSSHWLNQIHVGTELFEGEGWLEAYGFRADVG